MTPRRSESENLDTARQQLAADATPNIEAIEPKKRTVTDATKAAALFNRLAQLVNQPIQRIEHIEFRNFRQRGFDVMLTDPPYSAHVHASAVSQSKRGGSRKRSLGFDCLSPVDRALVAEAASSTLRWSVIFSDVEGSGALRESAIESGAEYIRTLPWVRWSMPQLSGDRPTTGLEHLLVFWGERSGRKNWNGPGNLTHLANKCLRGEGKHKAEKPLDLCLDLVSWFSLPGETVFDPFAGAGTIGVACKLLGRSYVGLERDPKWATLAGARIEKELSAGDLKRVQSWLDSDLEPTAQGKGPTAERAAMRAADKALVRQAHEAAA